MNKKYMDFVPKKVAKKQSSVGVRAKSRPELEKWPDEEEEPKAKLDLGLEKRVGNLASKAKLEPKGKTVAGKTKVVQNGASVKKAKLGLPVRPAFVNTEKVRKRPLSKNVYPKKTVEPKAEVPVAPVTIFDKPEKDSKVGLIVTIIITIILGAAAGTIAFLLLPK